MRILLFFVCLWVLVGLTSLTYAQTPPADKAAAKADDKAKPANSDKPAAPLPFWKEKLPLVTGKIEARYDTNRDGIMQEASTKIFLRDVRDEVNEKTFYNIGDSGILKAYDKNKDGIISKLELQDILKDLKED